jgi:hypothetical protein
MLCFSPHPPPLEPKPAETLLGGSKQESLNNLEFVFYSSAVIEILNLKINQDLSSAAFSKQQFLKFSYREGKRKKLY